MEPWSGVLGAEACYRHRRSGPEEQYDPNGGGSSITELPTGGTAEAAVANAGRLGRVERSKNKGQRRAGECARPSTTLVGRRCMGGELFSGCEELRNFGVQQTFWDQLLGAASRTVRFLLANTS
jgi:hypothetical protein